MYHLAEELRFVIRTNFECEGYRARVEEIDSKFTAMQERAFTELGDDASAQRVLLVRTPLGFSLAPKGNGEAIGEQE